MRAPAGLAAGTRFVGSNIDMGREARWGCVDAGAGAAWEEGGVEGRVCVALRTCG